MDAIWPFVRSMLPVGPAVPVVSVLKLSGVIAAQGRLSTALNLNTLGNAIERAFLGAGVKAVALAINSPGGSAAQAMLIFSRIRSLSREKEIPVYAFAEDVAASGGYMLACAADEIYATEGSIVGSIGVIAAGFGFQDLMSKLGIERRLYAVGARKVLLDPFKPVDEDEVRRLQSVQKEVHEAFKALVRERRGAKLKGSDEELFSGEFWTGARARDLGLIDGVGDLRSVMRARFGDKVRFRVLALERGPFRRRLNVLEWPRTVSSPRWTPAAVLDDALSVLEARAIWQRFGL
jgi:signal peptide peptidase SppA